MHTIQTDGEVETEPSLKPPAPSNDVTVQVSRPMPPLYKYCHPARVDVLKNQMIRYSSPATLNDPFELRPHISAIASPAHIEAEHHRLIGPTLDEELAKLPRHQRRKLARSKEIAALRANSSFAHEVARDVLPAVRDGLARGIEAIGILCLTESPANLLMWAHYADSHRGFVIEFNPGSQFFDRRITHDDELRHLRRVTYSTTRPSIVIADTENFSAFLIKGTDWSYEAEWRIMDGIQFASKIIGSGPEAIHLFAFPGAAIRSIIFGCRMPETKRTEITKIVTSNREYQHVVCKQAKIDETHYRVLIPTE